MVILLKFAVPFCCLLSPPVIFPIIVAVSFIVTSLLFASLALLPPPVISPVITASPLIVTLFSLVAVPPLFVFPPMTLPVTVAESIIILFFDDSPCSAFPPETLPVTVAPSLIVTLFSFAVPTPGIQAPAKALSLFTDVPDPDIIRLLLFALILIPGLLTFVPAISN